MLGRFSEFTVFLSALIRFNNSSLDTYELDPIDALRISAGLFFWFLNVSKNDLTNKPTFLRS